MQTLSPTEPVQSFAVPGCMHTCGPDCTPAPDGSLSSPGLRDYPRSTPKRWPINTDVLDSPACSMAEFAEYPTRLYLVTGSSIQVAADTIEEMLDKAVPWAHEGSRIVRVPVVPYYEDQSDSRSGRTVGSAPIAGGGVGGECGATLWVRDPRGHYSRPRAVLHALGAPVTYIQDNPGSGYDVSTLQAWWVNGNAANKPDLDGFWVQCEQSRKEHADLCSALDFEWNWRHYAAWTDMGHDTQLALF